MSLLLTAFGFDALNPWLDDQRADGPVVIVDNAGRGLDDHAGILAMALDELRAGGRSADVVDVGGGDLTPLRRAAAVVMTGGDPFRLLGDLRRSGADRLLVAARGLPIAGQSAGAIVCGPDLSPIRLTSPFAPAADQDLTGLALTDTLVLPHHGQPERNARHRQAALRVGAGKHTPQALTPLWDDETLIEADGGWRIQRGGLLTREAQNDDAAAVADVFHQAAVAAWSGFLGSAIERQTDALWAQRIATAGARFLVTEDAVGVLSFVCWTANDDGASGEIDLLYTHPRAWGNGSGRRLLERATWRLLCEGFRDAVLWTEARNERALGVYRRNGWRTDGAVDEREFAGVPIRNLRHRLDLTRYAGGA
ncbi:MAG: GNAT family N-acetyltransferase [Pseudomonadales bacterium]